VRRIREGDAAQFELLAKRYAAKIYGLAMRLTRNPSDAEDAVQQSFLQGTTLNCPPMPQLKSPACLSLRFPTKNRA